MATNNPDRIIRFAMKNAGLLQEGDDPNSEQLAEYLVRLQDMINFWQTQGLKLWLQSEQLITLVAGQATYTVKVGGDVSITKPMRVLQAFYQDANSQRRPIDPPLSRDEYTRLSNIVTPGSINSYFVDKARDQLNISFWNTPDAQAASGFVHAVIQRQVGILTSLTDDMDFPMEWFLALHWGLSSDICTGQPMQVQSRCATFAEGYRGALDDWDVEDASTSFQPDPRGLSGSAFR